MANQVTGGSSRITLYRETSLKNPDADTGIELAIISEGFTATANKSQQAVITSKRGAAKPKRGLNTMAGSLEVPAYAPQLGHLFRALCGAPTTTTATAKACTASAVTDLGSGFVGIPCAGHGFLQDGRISIVGTTNYDGAYRVEAGTTDDVIAISAPFIAETLTADMSIYRGRVATISGAVVQLTEAAEATDSTDAVEATVKMTTTELHGLYVGDTITISGTTNYDETYTLLDGTTEKSLVITASYEEETLTAALAVPQFYEHVYALPKVQPSVCLEKVFDFDDGASSSPVRRFLGCKVNALNVSLGGDSADMSVTMDMSPLEEVATSAALSDEPAYLSSAGFSAIEGSIFIGGERRGDIESGSITSSFGIETKAAVGDRGSYSRSNEGEPDCKVTLSTFLETDELQSLSDNDTTTSFTAVFCGTDGEELHYNLPEVELSTSGVSITTKTGLMQDITAMAFVDTADTALYLTMINRVSTYA
ncbi:MAG: phage tail tube protein [Pseudomonadota bacterium]